MDVVDRGSLNDHSSDRMPAGAAAARHGGPASRRTRPVGGPTTDDGGASSKAPESRQERLDRIRQEILAGTYDTEERLEAAVDRMFESWSM